MGVDVVLVFPSYKQMSNQPLGIAYLGSFLRENGYSVRLVDFGASYNEFDKFARDLKNMDPTVVGVSTNTPIYFRSGRRLSGFIRQVLPESFLVIGGPHASGYQERVLEDNDLFDAVVVGEGEHTMLELVQGVSDGKKKLDDIDGLIYREGERIRINRPRRLIQELDALPFPARDLLPPMEKYFCITLCTSRGCPYGCIFCDKSIFGRSWRGRSAANVVDEIELLAKEYGNLMRDREFHISIVDDAFNLDMRRAKRICDEIIARDIEVELVCINGIRADAVDEELLSKMKRAGWSYIQYGIETADNEILRTIGKGETVQQIVKAIGLTKKVGIKVGGSFIVDLPGMTAQRAEKTVKLIEQLKLDSCGISFATPLPRTPLWDYVFKEDIPREGIQVLGDPSTSGWDVPIFETKEFAFEQKISVYEKMCSARNRALRRKFLRKLIEPKRYLKRRDWRQIRSILMNYYNVFSDRKTRKV